MFRMEKDMFITLCNDLKTNYEAEGSRRMSVVEVLGMCNLFILGQGVGVRLAQ